ncbi:unnamed protein product [Adineta ricciae]|uniref:Nardilysin n=1 Tax=Adineta ricciae TaxID=249248 RepID=A0A814JNC8_ADIRI|nr:unnamed protein product [Adineta ricciae]
MVIRSSMPIAQDEETTDQHGHVLITEYLTGTNRTIIEEHNIIAVSPNDHRWYRLIELRNGLRCMLVTSNVHEDEDEEEEDDSGDADDTMDRLSSSDVEEAFLQYHMVTTVALCIPAGSLLDSANLQGLAHLTEHLLFSSSSKYPEVNCLDAFVSYHGGTVHAYTELEFTVILIEISSNRIVETLDILLHSLIDPLMSLETIYDQMQTLDEEYTIAQTDDHYRATRLLAYLAREDHPIKQFSWGNKTSLSELIENRNSTELLRKLVKDRYCIPEGMNLVMISNESFRIMQQRIERLFCLMKRSFKTLPDYISLKDPWNTDEFKRFHLVYPFEDIHQLRLSFPLSSIDESWKVKPEDYIRFIFAHEAPGSLNSYLKNKLWINHIDFDLGSSQFYHNSGSSLFTIILHLTRQGLKNIQSIIDSVFEVTYLLRRLGPLKRVYDDMQLADLHAFLFQDKIDTITYADTIVRNLRKYPALFVLFGHDLHLQFEPVTIFKAINTLDPRTCNIMLITKLSSLHCDQIEPYFNIKYGQFEIPDHWMSYWLNPNVNPALTIPDSSQYLAVDFSIKPFDVPPNEIPVVLLKEQFGTLWYFRNQQTLPKAFFYLHFLSPYVNLSPQHSCLFDLYTLIINSLLQAHAYPGKASHISINFFPTDTGLILKLSGFNQHLSKYLEAVLQVLNNFPINEEGTIAWKQELKNQYVRELNHSNKLIKHVRLYFLKGTWWPVFEKIQFLDDITHKQIMDFSSLFRLNLTVNMLVAGNMTGEESKELFHTTRTILQLNFVAQILLPSLRAVQIPARGSIIKISSYQSNDCATHMLIFFEHGRTSIRDYVLIEILAETIQESLEDYLQSAGQSHFTCHITLRDTYGIVSLQIELIFSSEIYNSLDVVDYVSKFFVLFKDIIMDTTKVEFDRLLTVFKNGKQNLDMSLQACVDRYWTEILLNSFVFDRNNQEREALETLTVTDMQDWYNEHIIAPSTRRQLIIIICSTDEVRPTAAGIVANNTASSMTNDYQRNRHSMRSSFGMTTDRLPRLGRRTDEMEDIDHEHMSLLQSKSDSKLRCLTTKRKHNINLRVTKSETLHLSQPFTYPNDRTKLEYIIKSFESIEIRDDEDTNPHDKSLKILVETDLTELQKSSYVFIHNLKDFKESCLLYNVAYIQ